METVTRSLVVRCWEARDEQAEHKGLLGGVTTLHDTITMDTCHLRLSKPTPRVGDNDVSMQVFDCNKTLVGDVDNGGDCARVGAGGIWNISEPSSELYCDPNTALIITNFFFLIIIMS